MKPQEAQKTPCPGTLCFVTTALICLATGMLTLAVQPGFLLADRLTGPAPAWMILMLCGFGLSAVYGTVYWALPAAFSLSLPGGPAVFLHYGFHLAGLVLVLLAAVFPGLPQAAMGIIFLACGGVIFVVNTGLSLRGLSHPDAASGFLTAVLVWLVTALFLGLPFAATTPLPLLKEYDWEVGWLVLVVAGVLINTVLGLALRLTSSGVGVSSAGWYALALTNLAIAWMFPAVTYGPLPGVMVCAGILLVGLLVCLGVVHGQLHQRVDGTLGWDERIQVTALWMAPVSCALLMLAVWERLQLLSPAPDEALAEVAAAEEAVGPSAWALLPMDWSAGLSALLAVAAPGLVALVFQLLKRGRPADVLLAETPVRERLAEHLLLASFFNYAVGAGMLMLGAWAASEKIVSLGAIFLVVGSLGFVGNFFHGLSRPASRQPAAPVCPAC